MKEESNRHIRRRNGKSIHAKNKTIHQETIIQEENQVQVTSFKPEAYGVISGYQGPNTYRVYVDQQELLCKLAK
jgi:hypothetical protein